MRQDKQQSQDTKRIEKSQQLVFPLDMELQIPQDAPVRLLGEILDQMNFGRLERAEKRGAQRKIPGRILFGLLVFGQMNGRYSSRQLEECCRYDVQYRWLLEGCDAPDHCMLSRFRGEVLPEIAGELFGQLMRYLNEQGELDYEHMFVDGTVGVGAFPNRSDSGTFLSFLNSVEQLHGRKFDSVTADARYESLENYLYLEKNKQLCFIKPTNYEVSKRKTRTGSAAGRIWTTAPNRMSFSARAAWLSGRLAARSGKAKPDLSPLSLSTAVKTVPAVRCGRNAPRPSTAKNKQLEVNLDFIRLRETSLKNITSPTGIQIRVNRSIMVEGAFGVIKQDYAFRRFLLRGKRKIQTELYLLAFAFDIRKLHARTHSKRKGSQLFQVGIA